MTPTTTTKQNLDPRFMYVLGCPLFEYLFEFFFLEIIHYLNIFVREHGVHAGPKDYFVVVVVVIRGSI
jgi:hypothetical protein